MKQKLLVLFGAPGSGKGYLGDCIKEELVENGATDFLYISTGDLLRAEIKAKTPLGQEIEQIVSSGKLVPDTIVSKLVIKALYEPQEIKILDGYPRTNTQMVDLVTIQDTLDYEVISIRRDTAVSLIKERVAKRRVCKDCKATHSVDDGCCPKCGGASEIRKDDAVIDARLAEYQKNTEHLWDILLTISSASLNVDGSVEAKEVAKEFVKLLF